MFSVCLLIKFLFSWTCMTIMLFTMMMTVDCCFQLAHAIFTSVCMCVFFYTYLKAFPFIPIFFSVFHVYTWKLLYSCELRWWAINIQHQHIHFIAMCIIHTHFFFITLYLLQRQISIFVFHVNCLNMDGICAYFNFIILSQRRR